ncbi:MAG: gamma-glutamyl-gamma-aminobutyrate hydrolase family protein [Chloroflexi bacterium]|nr:MAG: gamma-glutamyl-gamma-aminobutyrate hydrolase family protein [Chloroflexota bacterium]
MRRPLVGVPSHSYDKVLDGTYPPSFLMTKVYIRSLELAGTAPIIIPLLDREDTLRAIYEQLDGLFLAGGVDVDPSLYGEPPHPKLGDVNRERDRVEITLLRWALEDGLPVLAVCRGIQVLNVAAGGTLYQDIESQVPNAIRHNYHKIKPRNYRAHEVIVEPETRLFDAIGAKVVRVNSLHHQAVKDVAPGFRVAARASDGVIEGIERLNGHYAVGVQWHPEALAEEDAAMQALFDTFIDEINKLKFSQMRKLRDLQVGSYGRG